MAITTKQPLSRKLFIRRSGIRTYCLLAAVLFLVCNARGNARAETASQFDVVVYGTTPGGIAAAISAARLGNRVVLVGEKNHIGGMMASGLGKTDIETKGAVGGLFREFVDRVDHYYVNKYGADSENVKLSRHGYYYEPSVAELVLNRMLQEEPRITLLKHRRLEEVSRHATRVTGITIKDLDTGKISELRGSVFIDATYEGDLAAYSGAAYRVGRESRSETGELNAGVLYMDYRTRAFLPGTTGEGDKRIAAYTYRLCLTNDPKNSYVLKSPPPGYDRRLYMGYRETGQKNDSGNLSASSEQQSPHASISFARAFSIAPIPNHKFDVNINPRPLGFIFGGENYKYPDGSWAIRDAIAQKIRNQTLGLLYFFQNDPEVPLETRQRLRQYNLPKDEFTDSDHFPWQLYVREARRLVGEYTLTEHDLLVGPELGRTKIHTDSIAAGEYPIDSFPTRRREPGHTVLEGYILMLKDLTRPYQIPYGVMVPKSVDGLLVPVAASATHVAFASIRLEPEWMALGQAAGVAAHLSIQEHVEPRAVQLDQLQRELLKEKQVLTYFQDIDPADPAYAAIQYFGTKGFFPGYLVRSHDAVDIATARKWLNLAIPNHAQLFASAFQGSGSVTMADLKTPLQQAGLSASASANSSGQAPLTRGEFCEVLYASIAK